MSSSASSFTVTLAPAATAAPSSSESASGASTWSSSQSNDSNVTTPPLAPAPRRPSVAGRQQAERLTNDSAPSSRAAVALACVACRSRHLKCDGESPCSRCLQDGAHCSYVRSRRGWKPSKNKNAGNSPMSPATAGNGLNVYPSPITPTIDAVGVSTETLDVTSGMAKYPLDFLRPAENRGGQLIIYPPPSAQLPVDASPAGLINAYYNFFHPAHPFLLPQLSMMEHLKDPRHRLLELAILYVGSFYVVTSETNSHQQELATALQQAHMLGRKDATAVQALLLYAIGTHMNDMERESAQVLSAAISMAYEIGLCQKEYAELHGVQHTPLEEFYRRTFWELYIVDGLFAGVNPEHSLQMAELYVMDYPLPVEDHEYTLGVVNTSANPKTLDDYEDAIFVDEDEEYIFSSGTYRIAAVRIVHVIAPLGRSPNASLEDIDNAETRLANWQMHLPDCKRRIVSKTGSLDEVMFGAHMIVSACTILLHRPRSDLTHEDVRNIVTCASSPLVILADQPELHTHKSMNAAMEICMLIKMPSPLVKHTPFFTCAINLAAVVYLSYWSFIATEAGDSVVKEHIKLNIGSLKALSKVMPIAHTVLGQAKGVAKDLFRSRKAVNNQYLGGQATREEVLNRMIDLSDEPEGMVGQGGAVSGTNVLAMQQQQLQQHAPHTHHQQLQLAGQTHAAITPTLDMSGLSGATTSVPAAAYYSTTSDMSMGSGPPNHSLAAGTTMPLSLAGVPSVVGGLGHSGLPPGSGI